MLKAKEVMTENVITVKKTTPVYEAVQLMVEHNISGVPVVDDEMALMGVLSEKDVIMLFYMQEEDEEKIVDDFMTQPAVFFDENENLVDICDFLTKNIFRRVPVTSNGKVVGIISVQNILEHVLQLRQQAIPSGKKTG